MNSIKKYIKDKKLELEIIGLESKLKAIESVIKCDDRKLNKEEILEIIND